MRVTIALAALGLASACAAGPAASPVREPLNVEADAPTGADGAAEIVRSEWERRLGVALPAELPAIRWFDGDPGCLRYNTNPASTCPVGLYQPDEIQLYRSADEPIYNTSLAHELLHWALDVSRGDPDGAHESPLWEDVVPVQREILAWEVPR